MEDFAMEPATGARGVGVNAPPPTETKGYLQQFLDWLVNLFTCCMNTPKSHSVPKPKEPKPHAPLNQKQQAQAAAKHKAVQNGVGPPRGKGQPLKGHQPVQAAKVMTPVPVNPKHVAIGMAKQFVDNNKGLSDRDLFKKHIDEKDAINNQLAELKKIPNINKEQQQIIKEFDGVIKRFNNFQKKHIDAISEFNNISVDVSILYTKAIQIPEKPNPAAFHDGITDLVREKKITIDQANVAVQIYNKNNSPPLNPISSTAVNQAKVEKQNQPKGEAAKIPVEPKQPDAPKKTGEAMPPKEALPAAKVNPPHKAVSAPPTNSLTNQEKYGKFVEATGGTKYETFPTTIMLRQMYVDFINKDPNAEMSNIFQAIDDAKIPGNVKHKIKKTLMELEPNAFEGKHPIQRSNQPNVPTNAANKPATAASAKPEVAKPQPQKPVTKYSTEQWQRHFNSNEIKTLFRDEVQKAMSGTNMSIEDQQACGVIHADIFRIYNECAGDRDKFNTQINLLHLNRNGGEAFSTEAKMIVNQLKRAAIDFHNREYSRHEPVPSNQLQTAAVDLNVASSIEKKIGELQNFANTLRNEQILEANTNITQLNQIISRDDFKNKTPQEQQSIIGNRDAWVRESKNLSSALQVFENKIAIFEKQVQIYKNQGPQQITITSLTNPGAYTYQAGKPKPAYFGQVFSNKPKGECKAGYYQLQNKDDPTKFVANTNFANQFLGGGVFRQHGAVQEEFMAMQMAQFTALLTEVEDLMTRIPHPNEGGGVMGGDPNPLLVCGLHSTLEIPNAAYAEGMGRIQTGVLMQNTKVLPNAPEVNMLAIAFSNLNSDVPSDLRGRERAQYLEGLSHHVSTLEEGLNVLVAGANVVKAQAEKLGKQPVMNSGRIGAGVFGHDPVAVVMLSRLASRITDVEINTYDYDDKKFPTDAFCNATWAKIDQNTKGMSVEQSVAYISEYLESSEHKQAVAQHKASINAQNPKPK